MQVPVQPFNQMATAGVLADRPVGIDQRLTSRQLARLASARCFSFVASHFVLILLQSYPFRALNGGFAFFGGESGHRT
jgi:hypothetical protein